MNSDTPPISKSRNLGIDVLKVIAIFTVVALHVQIWGFDKHLPSGLSFNSYFWNLLGRISLICIPVFGIISGYLQVYHEVRYRKLIPIWLMVFLYSILGEIIGMVFCGQQEFHWTYALLPVLRCRWWYVTAYFVLCVFMPVLNKGIQGLTNRQCLGLLALIPLVCCTNIFSSSLSCVISPAFSVFNLIWLYIVGGCIHRLHDAQRDDKLPKNCRWLFHNRLLTACLMGTMVLYLVVVAIPFLVPGIPERYYSFLTDNFYAPLNILITLLLVLLCLTRTWGWCGRLCSGLAPYSLDIYVFHMHPCLGELMFCSFGLISLTKLNCLQIAGLTVLRILGIVALCAVVAWLRRSLFKVCRIVS